MLEPINKEVLQRKLREILQVPEDESTFHAAQAEAICTAVDFLSDIVSDLLEKQHNMEDTIGQLTMSSELHTSMLKRILNPAEYEQVYCECLGISGRMQ